MSISILPEWITDLSLQKQAVLLSAIRGPDGFRKHHPCKPLLYFYRAFVLKAAHKGRMLTTGEHVGSLMTLRGFDDMYVWDEAVAEFESVLDELPVHYFGHFMHGVQLLMYEHPEASVRVRWRTVYYKCCAYIHLPIETKETMDSRLSDFGRALGEIHD